MEKKKLSPVASGVLNAVVSLVLIIAVYFVLSLIRKTPFTEKLSDPINIAIIILGPISAGISSWNKAKNKEAEKEKKEL